LEVLASAMRRSKDNTGWNVATNIADVPSECGHYSIYDGFDIRGCGVTWDMRRSIQENSWFSSLKRGLFLWKPDLDGSAALWLDGKIKCQHCGGIFEISDHDEHLVLAHDLPDDDEDY